MATGLIGATAAGAMLYKGSGSSSTSSTNNGSAQESTSWMDEHSDAIETGVYTTLGVGAALAADQFLTKTGEKSYARKAWNWITSPLRSKPKDEDSSEEDVSVSKRRSGTVSASGFRPNATRVPSSPELNNWEIPQRFAEAIDNGDQRNDGARRVPQVQFPEMAECPRSQMAPRVEQEAARGQSQPQNHTVENKAPEENPKCGIYKILAKRPVWKSFKTNKYDPAGVTPFDKGDKYIVKGDTARIVKVEIVKTQNGEAVYGQLHNFGTEQLWIVLFDEEGKYAEHESEFAYREVEPRIQENDETAALRKRFENINPDCRYEKTWQCVCEKINSCDSKCSCGATWDQSMEKRVERLQ